MVAQLFDVFVDDLIFLDSPLSNEVLRRRAAQDECEVGLSSVSELQVSRWLQPATDQLLLNHDIFARDELADLTACYNTALLLTALGILILDQHLLVTMRLFLWPLVQLDDAVNSISLLLSDPGLFQGVSKLTQLVSLQPGELILEQGLLPLADGWQFEILLFLVLSFLFFKATSLKEEDVLQLLVVDLLLLTIDLRQYVLLSSVDIKPAVVASFLDSSPYSLSNGRFPSLLRFDKNLLL